MPAAARATALDLLMRINEGGEFTHLVLREVLAAEGNNPQKGLIKRLTAGTVERRLELDYIIDCYAKTPTSAMRPLVRNLLRLAAYEILYMDNTPDRAACDEAVKLAAKRGFLPLTGFVNGVLRNIARHKENLPCPDAAKEPLRYLSVRYAMPEWLIEKWQREYGETPTESLLAGLMAERPLTLRWRGGAPLEKNSGWENVALRPHPYLAYAYELTGSDDVAALPGYAEGQFAVQDAAAMLAVEMADIKSGGFVVDVCAAPGGKALHAAETARQVIARDISTAKCQLIRENAARLQQDNIDIAVHDATVLDESLCESADVLLADLPCSGLGAIARKPDIKYRATPATLAAACELQRRILAVVWQYVKPGGALLYSTCTLNYDENAGMMKWFAASYPFEAEEERTLLPGIDPTDGFYICRLRRVSQP
jgi:16S rRNA (cytosine967-C5)-methyltransferase